jgi:hypothetical protein
MTAVLQSRESVSFTPASRRSAGSINRLFGAKSRHRADGQARRRYFTCLFASLARESGDCGMVKDISFAVPYEAVDEMIQAACCPLRGQL